MYNYNKIQYLTLAFLAAFITLSAIPFGAAAREAVPGVVTEYDFKVGGEPGEDPHLKTQPERQFELESDNLGSSAGVTSFNKDITGIQAECAREGQGRFGGSRVNLVWRMILRSWLWTLHR